MDPVLFHGPAPLTYYGLVFALTMLGGFFLWRWQMLRGGHDEQTASIFLAYGLIAVVLGARLGHCLFYDLERCFSPWYTFLMVWRGGLASHGATVGLVLALLIFSLRHQITFSEVMDRFSFSAALGAGMIRLGNLFNSEIVGRVTDGGWGVRFPRHDQLPLEQVPLRHPSQLYELGLGLLVLALLLVVDRRLGEVRRPRGLLGALFFVTYFAGRFVVEWFKEYQALPAGGLTMGQWLSMVPWGFGVGWLALIAWRRGS